MSTFFYFRPVAELGGSHNRELQASLIPTRALFTNVKELAYICEVGEIIRKAVTEAAASGGSVVEEQLP